MFRKRIQITGCVQGVGFRPACFRLAKLLNLTGLVLNDTKGVTLELQGPPDHINLFITRLQSPPDKPPMATINSLITQDLQPIPHESDFIIEPSSHAGSPLSQVTADIAVCPDCIAEMRTNSDLRHQYPFINCTNCGPRYSIIKTIPYDRPNTTMAPFKMCQKCEDQYKNPLNRRFHAQPVACQSDGPQIWLTDNNGQKLTSDTETTLKKAAQLLKIGQIGAIKGIGGFHLAVNALDNAAVNLLRTRKHREHKPFALMANSIETIKKYAFLDEKSTNLLQSPQSPIVLLNRIPNTDLAPSVARGTNTLGFMLPYAPLHHLLFDHCPPVLVMTSGNVSDEPLICENQPAIDNLAHIADFFLMHNRQVFRQVDDSIAHFITEKPALLRRSRGYVPTPVFAPENFDTDLLATGADLKNTFCLGKKGQLIPSEHIGDLEDARVWRHYKSSIDHLKQLFEVNPKVAACDLHPAYFSTQYANSLPDVEIIPIQHHWAHIAAVLAEHRITDPVIGLVCDGTGYGTDGAIWGCECLIASLANFTRFGHLDYYQLPGGDKASKEAIRPATALLTKAYGSVNDIPQWILERVESDPAKRKIIALQLKNNINCVTSSSLGRVFDAAAAILGLGTCNNFEAELPIALEAAITPDIDETYPYTLDNNTILSLSDTIKGIITDIAAGVQPGAASAKFHNTIADALCEMAQRARGATGLNTVALGGGVFCNRYLTNRVFKLLRKMNFRVLYNFDFPSNDGGVALGQAAIAAHILAHR